MENPHPVAIVTGGANGIGRAIAEHLLADGWRVCIVDLPCSGASKVFPPRGRNVLSIEGNVAEEDTVKRAVQTAHERFGRLDAIVSNAGIMRRKPLRQLALAEWREVIDTNLTATFLLAGEAEDALRRTKGAIVSIASKRALMSEPNTESYSASKGGLVALTHALAVSLGPDVRVNCVSPGWIATDPGEKLRRKDHVQHPVGPAGRPHDIAEIVTFLVERKRAGFVTRARFI